MKSRAARWLSLVVGAAMVTSVSAEDGPVLTQDEQARLEKDGFCIGGTIEGDGEMVDAYIGNPCVFITSDSVLSLFHGMMRKTMKERDESLASLLKTELKLCSDRLDKMDPVEPGADPATCKAAMIRAKIVCGTALRLLDPEWRAADPAIAREIDAEAARVETAQERVKSAWLGEPEPMFKGIDYSNFKVVGLHEATGEGWRYFRAVRFLQTIPFRLSRKVELYSACYLLSSSEGPGRSSVFRRVSDSNCYISRSAIQRVGELHGSQTGDTPVLRGMLGDSLDFQRTKSNVAATPAVTNTLIADVPMPLSEEDSRMISPLFMPDSVLFQSVQNKFLGANALPDPLLAAAWFGDMQVKSQMIQKYPGCESLFADKPPVQPDVPYGKSGILFDAYDSALRILMSGPEAGAPDFMRKDAWRLKTRQTVLGSWARMRNCFALEGFGGRGFGGWPPDSPGFVEPCPDFYQKLADIAVTMQFVARECEDAKSPTAEVSVALQVSQWERFAALCSRLEAMAHKQLRGVDWNDSDRKFLGMYGYMMGGCDDDSRAAAVSRAASGSTLIAASGPNRVIWVNYPWKGKNVLCRGGVMTFYSFATSEPMTDVEWQARMQGSPPPQPPDWLQPLGLKPVKTPKPR